MSLVAFGRLSTALVQRLPMQTQRSALALTGLLAFGAYTMVLSGAAPMDGLVWISLAILAASLISGVAGFAFSAICGAMLFHLLDDPVHAVQIMMICSVGGQSLMVWALWRKIPWRALAAFLTGAAVGLPLGILVLLHAQPALYFQVIGAGIVLYAVFMLRRRPMIVRRQNALFDAIAGFLGGVTGGAAAFPGMFVTIWCGFKGWPKEQQRALFQPFILIVQLAAIALMSVPGFVPENRPAFDFAGIVYLPAMLLGSSLGLACFHRLSDRQFSLAVNLLLVVSGLSFLV